MAHSLDLNGMLISSLGEKIPCKLVNISDEGWLDIYSIDPVEVEGRFQLVIGAPRLQAVVRVNFVQSEGDAWHVKATPEGGVANLQAKIIEQKVRGLIR